MASRASTNAMESAIGVGVKKAFLFVVRRKKPATTIGSSSMDPPTAHSAIAWFSQLDAG